MASKKRLTNPESPKTLAAHKLALAKELLDDVELSRLQAEQMLLKASRLARLVDEPKTRQWIDFELRGYHDSDECRELMRRFGRFTDENKKLGYWNPLSGVAASLEANQAEVRQLRIPDVSISISSANPSERVATDPWGNDNRAIERALAPASTIAARLSGLTDNAARLRQIQSRVFAAIHDFAVQTYYALAFRGEAESVFRTNQTHIDGLLREQASDVLEKLPSVSARLTEGDAEAISQAMNSCRRMIKALADAKQPPQDGEVELRGKPSKVGSAEVLNRIEYFLRTHCSSEGRRTRLSSNVRAIWERTSAGTHADITTGEAQALFLQTYLTLGEILDACT